MQNMKQFRYKTALMLGSYHFVGEQLCASTLLLVLRVSLLPRETEVTSSASGSVA